MLITASFFPLQVLYMSNNSVKDWSEFQKIAELQKLQDLLFVGKLEGVSPWPIEGKLVS